ncbi:MAG: sulfotransferase domain-containing protein [Bacteroidia bacterium]|nr:sulfotransferase domain-containing protein [Bacteroidia bacterium]NNE15817.1 hypothetical protein [Saprospiraceae bacterium]
MIRPNTFLIGVQKAGTSSLYNWISQHPDVCGPLSMKDIPFFIDDKMFVKGEEFLDRTYRHYYNNERLVLNGSAHSVFFPYAIKRIKEFDPKSKLILILRDPVERAISSYNFSVNRNFDEDDILTSIHKEDQRLNGDDLKMVMETTYINHGYYSKQIKNLFEIVKKEDVLILFYDDLKNNPEHLMSETYSFLGLDDTFKPDFKLLNKTGTIRFKMLNRIIFNNSKWKSFIMKYFLNHLMPYDFKYRFKLFLKKITNKESSTKTTNSTINVKNDAELKKHLFDFFVDEIIELEQLINKDLSSWKKHGNNKLLEKVK